VKSGQPRDSGVGGEIRLYTLSAIYGTEEGSY